MKSTPPRPTGRKLTKLQAVNHVHRVINYAGLLSTDKEALISAMRDAESSGRSSPDRAHDWEGLLVPLRRAIGVLSSGTSDWSADPLRAPVFSAYLLTLRRTRDRIQYAQAKHAGLSIPEVAATFDPALPLKGMAWHAWVPEKVKHAMMRAFDKLYCVDYPAAGRTTGRRIIPFSTLAERKSTEARWLALEARILRLIEAGDEPDCWLLEALDIVRRRDSKDAPPMIWHHLLPLEMQRRRREALAATPVWRRATLAATPVWGKEALAAMPLPTGGGA